MAPLATGALAQGAAWAAAWPNTDFSKTSVACSEILSGGPPRDGIPPLARTVRVGDRAWSLNRVGEAGEVSEAGVTITWASGQASALDTARIGAGYDGARSGSVTPGATTCPMT